MWTNPLAHRKIGLIGICILWVCVGVAQPAPKSELGRDRTAVVVADQHRSPLAPAPPDEVLMTVHQTNKVKLRAKLPARILKWQSSWLWFQFRISLSDDEDCRNDIKRLSVLLDNNAYLDVYDNLETPVQRADFWRYARLYLEGGVYADLDVVARASLRPLLKTFFCDKCKRVSDQIVFVESDWFATGVLGTIALALRFTDMVRLPQYRQCILIAGRPHHPLYKLTLDMIVESFAEGEWRSKEGLARTLLLTGPGVFTDAVNLYRSMHGEHTITFVSRHDGHFHFEHTGVGSWKRKETMFFQEKPGIAVMIIVCVLLSVLMRIPDLGTFRRRTWLKIMTRVDNFRRLVFGRMFLQRR
eukprot:m.76926 g.76926  ORF g.76926 m.76926 type:complete len:357 (-) comp24953_c0_seq1:122-1192(-)